MDITGFEKKLFEIGIEITFKSFIVWCENRDIVGCDGVF